MYVYELAQKKEFNHHDKTKNIDLIDVFVLIYLIILRIVFRIRLRH